MVLADMGSFNQIRKMSELLHEKYDKIDVLIYNAGAQIHDYGLSEDGYEVTFAVNHLS